jgi:putative transposon-encoded protein
MYLLISWECRKRKQKKGVIKTNDQVEAYIDKELGYQGRSGKLPVPESSLYEGLYCL